MHDRELVGMIGHQYQGLRQPEKARAFYAQAAAADPRGINPRIRIKRAERDAPKPLAQALAHHQ